MHIHVNTKHLQEYKQKLTSLKRSAFPNAIRNTLNDAAFDMKQNTLHASASRNFKHTRSKNFFKSFTQVEKAKGFDISQMRAITGMVDRGKDSVKTALENMNLHEKGGSIRKGSTYLQGARISKGFGRLVRKANYLENLDIIEDSKLTYMEKVAKAFKEKKAFIHNGYLISVTSMSHKGKGKKRKVKIKTVLLTKKRKNVKINPNHFITEAGGITQKRIPFIFKNQADRQISRYTK